MDVWREMLRPAGNEVIARSLRLTVSAVAHRRTPILRLLEARDTQ
jgi:hypothetical protein